MNYVYFDWLSLIFAVKLIKPNIFSVVAHVAAFAQAVCKQLSDFPPAIPSPHPGATVPLATHPQTQA